MIAINCFDTAIELREQGFWPVGIYPPGIERGKKLTKGKEPIGTEWGLRRWSEWDLRRRWRQYPSAGCGIGLGPDRGPGGAWLIDLEGDGPRAEESLLLLLGGEVVTTLSWGSVRGWHRVFICDGVRLLDCLLRAGATEGKGLKVGVWHLDALPDLEIRVGGYFPDGVVKQVQSVVPPTPGTTGEPRQWISNGQATQLPEAAYAFLDGIAERAAIQTEPTNHEAAQPVSPPPNGQLTESMATASPSAVDRCRAYLAKVVPGVQGQNGSIPMMRAACVIVRFGIENGPDAYQLLSEYGATCDPPWDDPAEINHKLDSAFKSEARRDFVDQDPTEREGRGQADPVADSPPVDQAASKESLSASPSDTKEKPKREPDPTQADILLKIASSATLFRDDGNKTYAAVPVSNHVEVHAIYSTSFGQWLLREYRDQMKGRMPTAEALKTARDGLDAVASAGPIEQVFLRVGEAKGNVYLDMATPDYRAIEINSSGWRIVDSQPVRFRRSDGMKPLPVPIRGGNLNDLRSFLNIPDDEFCLMVGWLASSLLPQGPYSILALIGEQGCGKSTLAEIAKRLVDPQKVMRSSPPKTAHDLAISADNRWVLSYENLTTLPQWMSDMICMCSTKGAYSTRGLYKNREEELFDFQRPVILNGISDFITEHGDLTDRCVFLHLAPISSEKRTTEKKFWPKFDAVLPSLFGALLDAIAGGLAKQSETADLPLPRMGDFGAFAEAVWRSLGHPDNEFLDAYGDNRKDAIASVLEDSPVGVAVMKLMDARTEAWGGTATDLLETLNGLVSEKVQKS